jgi:uncharacterized membrane protein
VLQHVVLYLVTAVLFLGIDVVWIKLVMRPLFDREVPHLLADEVRMAPAAGFYLLYVVGVLWFASAGGLAGSKGIGRVAFDAAFLGFLAYGTYEATNYATLKGWTAQMAAIDIAWGTAFTAFVAVAGLLITRAVMGR